MLRLVIFLLGSAGLFLLSWNSFKKPATHGFPRFFAFEALLALVVLNVPYWFSTPISIPQLISWSLLLVSAYLAISSILTFRKSGAPDPSIKDTSRIGFEKTTRLITHGPYRFIRHPMYASLLLLALGVFLKQINIITFLLLLLIFMALVATALLEEKENVNIFGNEYMNYMRHTRRFIPFLF